MKEKDFPFIYNLKYRRLTLLLFIFFISKEVVIAQDKPPITFGKVSSADFNLPKSNIIDSNTSAVIIADVGNTSFVGNKKGWISYVYKRYTRIRIIDKKAFDEATVRISLYRNEDDEEKLENIEGTSYNLENGKVVETRLDKKDIFEVKTDKNRVEKKFTMPAVKEGSIIEYSYTIISDFDFNLPDWEFQNIKYPCLWSEYNVNIPSLLVYIFSRQGTHAFFIDKSSEGYQSYMIKEKSDQSAALGSLDKSYDVNATVVKRRWAMKDVPYFNVENYISTPNNYIDKIEFQLAKTYNGETTREVKNSWKKATEDLLDESDFGRPLKPDNLDFSNEVNNIIGNGIGELENAKKIYNYIQGNITCTNHYNKYIKTSLREVLKKKNGDVGEVNLLLAAMLLQAHIHADPVLLSTKEFGFNSARYPLLQRLNYVICRIAINGHVYYLDAAQPMLGFGRLSEDCYNGHARVICEKDSASVYFFSDSIQESKVTNIFIVNDEKGNAMMNGSFQSQLGYYESTDVREKIVKNGEKDFFKHIQLSYGSDTKIENAAIDSLKQYEEPIKLHYDFSFKNNTEESIIYFNPVMGEAYKENPFKATERRYPIEMPYPTDEMYILNMEIPAGYTVDELPKSAKVAYNENEGFFEYLIQKDATNIQLRCHIKLNKATFAAEDYNSLREFFGYVVKKQSEQIVFKKKK